VPSHPTRPIQYGVGVAKTAIAAILFALAFGAAASAQDDPSRLEPAPPRTATAASDDGAFHVVLGAFVTAAGTDVAVSMYQIGRGTAREAAFGSWWQDSPVAFAATKSALTALFAYQLQRLHRTRPKAAFILGIASASVEAALVARSARIQQPGRR
jgi:hypothetical protein